MSAVPRWFERKFEFTFPAEQYPNLCVRLRGTPARLEEIVRGAKPQRLVRRPGENWSAQEHAGHLLDLEPLWLSRVEDFVRGGDVLTAADLSNRKTNEARHNERSAQEILADFRREGRVAASSGEARTCPDHAHHAAPAAEDTDAAGAPSLLCCRAR